MDREVLAGHSVVILLLNGVFMDHCKVVKSEVFSIKWLHKMASPAQ